MNPERVFVLGHRGMLGHVVARYLAEQGHEIVTSPLRYSGKPQDALLQTVRGSGCAWVVNAIGSIPQKTPDDAQYFLLNTLLPLHLLLEMQADQRLIHPSTDCVFTGREGGYASVDRKDCEDVYGLSKALGDQVSLDGRVLVMRASVIGPDLGAGVGLLGWFLKQRGTVKGYTNRFWNGITTLEWARAAQEVMAGKAPQSRGMVQLGVLERYSKYQMLGLFNEIWHRDVVIEASAPVPAVDRTLQPEWVRKPLREQLLELKAWMESVPK